jgi:hypothetical protein
MNRTHEEMAMKQFRLAVVAIALGSTSAWAAPVDIAGTWECRQPGVQYRNKPPILYVSDAPGSAEVTIEVDGFSREVYGRAALVQDPDGWWKVKPAKGQEFAVRPEGGSKQRTPAMALRWPDSKSDYRCLRLPVSATRPATSPSPGAENAPGTLSVPPSDSPDNKEPETKE